MFWVGVGKCQQDQLDELVPADCSKQAEQPQQTSSHCVIQTVQKNLNQLAS